MNDDSYKVTIAALLHDIGKFYQRAENHLDKINLYQQYVKQDGSYAHGGFTAKFINSFINDQLEDFSEVLHLSANHHKSVDSIIKKADIIAAGHDRNDKDMELLERNEDNESTTTNYVTKRMNIIFNEVKLSDNLNNSYLVNLSPLSNYGFSKESYEKDTKSSRKEYKELFFMMRADLDKMNRINYKDYVTLHHLLYPIIKEYTTCIPASTMINAKEKMTVVSLFDHLKLTTAIANCMEKCDNRKYILLDYGISGIQKFIYKVSEGRESKPNVAKMLRTRSFYIGIVVDFLTYYIANEFNLTYENVLYSSGGRGRILLPAIPDFDNKIREINKKIEKGLFYFHNAELALNLKYYVIEEKELVETSISDLVTFENQITISEKNKKFATVISDSSFKNISKNINNMCPMCNTNESNNGLCSFCQSMLNLNDKVLTKKDSFVVEFNYNNYISKNNSLFELNIPGIGSIVIYDSLNSIIINPKSYYISINDHYIGETKFYAKSNIGSKSFEEIAKENEGDEKLAVIKMDVDNLGYIFLKGINKSRETISKNLTLSRMTDYFFTKKLVSICNKEIYKKSIYINYAGGDDLVIICPASMSTDLVNDIYDEFNTFTGHNVSMHISTGIEIFNPTSPVRYAVERAEDKLSASKDNKAKNSFCVFDVVLSNENVSKLISDINMFVKGINSEEKDYKLSRTGLYNIYSYILKSLSGNNHLKYIPLIAYMLRRNMNSYWQDKFKNIFINKDINVDTLKYYKVVFSFVLLKTRDKENKDE